MKLIAAGFGILVYRHRNGTYSMVENGYHTSISREHAEALAKDIGL